MADGSKIEWTDATWNPVTGCSVVSAGCKHCYAMKLAGTRLQRHPSRAGLTRDTTAGPVWNGEVRFNEQWLDQPLRWTKPRLIFVCAHGDLFHEAVPDEWLDRVFAMMALCPQHTFQVLTKRPARMRAYLLDDKRKALVVNAAMRLFDIDGIAAYEWPLPNVWLGVSVEEQATADERIPLLLQTPAAVRWISAEPLLGPIDLTRLPEDTCASECCGMQRLDALTGQSICDLSQQEFDKNERIDWVVVGGESGTNARPMHPDWARSLRDQCAIAGVPFLFKQWGGWAPRRPGPERDGLDGSTPLPAVDIWPCGYTAKDGIEFRARPPSTDGVLRQSMWRVGKKAAGRLLDGKLHDGYPETPK